MPQIPNDLSEVWSEKIGSTGWLRTIIFVLVVAAVLLLTVIWNVPLWSVSSETSLAGRFASAAVDITVAVLIADLVWSWTRTVIDRRLGSYEVPQHGSAPGPEARMATVPSMNETIPQKWEL